MTNKQINAAIHEALGSPLGCPRGCSDPGCAYNRGLNYCADHNAMSEAEWFLHEKQIDIFAHLLLPKGRTWRNFRPTARQRAEAFLRALGKWKEVQG